MIHSQKHLFSLPEDSTYLNCAYMSPMLQSVEQAGQEAIILKRAPHQITAEDFFTDTERLRIAYAQLINAPEPKRIVTISSVSYGIATVVNNISLESGDEIIVADEQFPSNYYAWEKAASQSGAILRTIAPPVKLQDREKQWNENILNAINANTKVVAMAHVHWADGTRFDLMAIREATKAVGALLIIDGTQSVGALPFDVQQIQPDALICAGYKWLMGPYAIGMAYYGEYFDDGNPIEENWINRKESQNFANLVNYASDYQPVSLRYGVGEQSNFILLPMMIVAINQLNEWQPKNIEQYCDSISQESVKALRQAGFDIADDAYRGKHLFGIRIPAHLNIDDINQKLKAANIFVSIRGNAIRVAPHLYNDSSDFDKLLEVLL
jgi:selenocysteine lyase/cysteine desulfurase